MNDFSDERSPVLQRLVALIPLILIAIIAMGGVLFGLLLIWPEWQDNNQMQTLAVGKGLALTATIQAIEGAADILQHQVENAEGRLSDAAGIFLTSAQADDMLDLLYRYAEDANVEILEVQLVPEEEPGNSDVVNARTFQIKVSGEPRSLLNFIVRIKEASAPSVSLSEVVVAREDVHSSLSMKLILYASPYASGIVLDGLPEQHIITPTAPSPTPFKMLPTATPSPTLTPTLAISASPTPTIVIASPTPAIDVMKPGTYNDDSPLLQYTQGNWIQIASLQGTDGSYRYSADSDAEVNFAFTGTSARVQYVGFHNFGIFEVYVDGVFWTAVDSYSQAGTFGREVFISGLPYGTHNVTIRNTGRQNPASDGSVIALDAVHVEQSVPPTATPALQTFGTN